MLKPFKNKKRAILVLLGFATIGGLALLFLKPKSVTVKQVKIETGTVLKTVSGSGTVVSKNEADLSFALGGRIEELKAEKGAQVEKRQYLGRIYNYDLLTDANTAKDNRDVALRDLDLYVDNYLNDQDGVGGSAQYAISVRRLEELASKAENAYQSTLGTLNKSYMYAPFAGTVVDIYIETGEIATAGSKVLKIADLNDLLFEVTIDQEDFGFLKVNQEVEMTLDAFDNRVFKAKVVELPKYTDDSLDFVVKLVFADESDKKDVVLGMTGDAEIIIEKKENVAYLPFDAIFYDTENKPYAWVIDSSNNRIGKYWLETGLEGDLQTEVLNPTDLTIVVPAESDFQDKLQEGYVAKLTD